MLTAAALGRVWCEQVQLLLFELSFDCLGLLMRNAVAEILTLFLQPRPIATCMAMSQSHIVDQFRGFEGTLN